MPVGVAYSPNGTLYVADAGAQRIREVKPDGSVLTLAGSGPVNEFGTYVVGGYVDGPALQARFNRPEGIVLNRSGDIFVADRLNHCIRRIHDGVVTTFAGGPTPGHSDGLGAAAAFNDPKSLAIDADDNLYVADVAVGLRKVTPGAEVSTLPVPLSADKGIVAVSVRGSGSNLEIAYIDSDALHYLRRSESHALGFRDPVTPFNEGQTLGFAGQVAIEGTNAVIVSDLRTNSVAHVQFNEGAFWPASTKRVIVAGRRPGSLAVGGFAEGNSATAEVDSPTGLAVSPSGFVALADSGNRRIRIIRDINTRIYVHPDFHDLTYRDGEYRIALVGDSYLFSDVMWPDTIAGVLESGLNRDSATVRLSRHAHVEFTSISGGTITSMSELVENYFDGGKANLVVLFVDQFSLDHDFDNNPALATNGAWRTEIPKTLREVGEALNESDTKFIVVVIPQGQSLAPFERLDFFEQQALTGALNYPEAAAKQLELDRVIASAGNRTFSLFSPMLESLLQTTPPILFNSDDHHMTVDGTVFAGNQLLRELEGWHPWAP